jgi:peptide/nickel transport system substrate-binding protein
MRFPRYVMPLIALVLLSLLVSCASPATTPTPTASASSPSPSPTSSPSSVVKEKIVRITQSWPCKLDPAVGQDNCASVAHMNLYDTLIMIDSAGKTLPHLAKSWDFNKDANSYTFHLNEGVKFHSGNVLAASDVAFSLKRMIAIGQGWDFLYKSNVSDVVVKDPLTVEVKLKTVFGPFVSALIRAPILDEKLVMANIKKDGIYGDFGDYGKEWLVTHDAGSGPYMVKEMKTAEYLYAVKFPEYWRGWDQNAPDAFKLIGTTESMTVRTLMSRKELEISDEWQTAEAYNTLAKMDGVNVVDFQAGVQMVMHFNTAKPPLDDVHFRKALQYCFDYQTCKEKIYPRGQLSNGPIGSALPGYDSSLPPFKLDLEKAKAELQQSKYANNVGDFPVDLVWASEVPDEEKIALMLQSNAQVLGIKINVIKSPWLKMVDSAGKQDTTPHLFTRSLSGIPYPEAGAIIQLYSSSSRGTIANVHWFNEQDQQTMDNLIADLMGTQDTAERLAKYKGAISQVINLAPDLWTVQMSQSHAYQSSYLIWPSAENASAGKGSNVVPGLRMYFWDMRFLPDKMP